MEVVVSKVFWDPLLKHYNENFSSTNYNVFYWTYRNIFLNLIGILQEEIPEADIYHSVATGYAGVIAAMAGYRKKGKIVLTEHGIYPREREEEIVHAQWVDKSFKSIWIDFFYFLSKITYKYCDVVITLFDYNRNLQIKNGADPSKSLVIPNGIDKDRFGNLDFEKREIFSIGAILRVVPIKDVKMMIKGFRVALRKLRNTKLYLIGPVDENPEYYEECVQMVKSLEMEDYVEFTGKVNVADYYKFLDLLLLTSISEGQPLSILEGLSAGIPFISTDVGNCREILTGKTEIGEAGVIIPLTSYVDLADSLVKMYHSRDRLKEMGENGKKIVEKYYSREIFIEGYRKIYRELGDKQWQE
jgi:glycosyltransferase involved in cell wall biosynthesis